MGVNSHKKERTAANDPSILGSLNGHSVTLLPVLLTLGHSNFSPLIVLVAASIANGKGRKDTCIGVSVTAVVAESQEEK